MDSSAAADASERDGKDHMSSAAAASNNSASRKEDDGEVPTNAPDAAKRQSAAASPQADNIRISELTKSDIVCGRGIPWTAYQGNQQMHQVVDEYRNRYMTSHKQDKRQVVKHVVKTLQTHYGARFVKQVMFSDRKDQDNDEELSSSNVPVVFRMVGDKIALEKVAHAFRCKHRQSTFGNTAAAATSSQNTTRNTTASASSATRPFGQPSAQQQSRMDSARAAREQKNIKKTAVAQSGVSPRAGVLAAVKAGTPSRNTAALQQSLVQPPHNTANPSIQTTAAQMLQQLLLPQPQQNNIAAAAQPLSLLQQHMNHQQSFLQQFAATQANVPAAAPTMMMTPSGMVATLAAQQPQQAPTLLQQLGLLAQQQQSQATQVRRSPAQQQQHDQNVAQAFLMGFVSAAANGQSQQQQHQR